MANPTTWKNESEAVRYEAKLCRRCRCELDSTKGDTRQFCRKHQDEQNAHNKKYRNKGKPNVDPQGIPSPHPQ